MAPTTPLSAPSAGGSKNAIAPCAATRCPSMRWASVACSLGVATSSMRRTEPSWQGSCSKPERVGILTACSCLASPYQLSNDHSFDLHRRCFPMNDEPVSRNKEFEVHRHMLEFEHKWTRRR